MTPNEFGMWALAVLAWILTGLIGLWGFHVVLTAIHGLRIDRTLNEKILENMENDDDCSDFD